METFLYQAYSGNNVNFSFHLANKRGVLAQKQTEICPVRKYLFNTLSWILTEKYKTYQA